MFFWLQLESCRTDFLSSLEMNKKDLPFSCKFIGKCGKWQISVTCYLNVRRSFCAALKNEKIYRNLLAWYLQCYLDPETTMSFKCLFIDEFIPSIKKDKGNLKIKGEKLSFHDDLAIFGTSYYFLLQKEWSEYLFRPE